MAKRMRRTPEQRAERLREQLAETEKKAAILAAKNNPVLLPLYEARGKLQTEIALQSRNFSEGPQSFENRRKSHELWIAEIDAWEAYSKVAGTHAKACRDELDTNIQALSARISKGETITADDIEDALDFDSSAEYDAAKHNLDLAQENRRNFKAQFAADESEEMEAAEAGA